MRSSLALLMIVILGGCASMNKTSLGATTGGLVGAGLGAVLGSQTGDAGTGLALGAAAGAGTGALIGRTFDRQRAAVDQHDEAIARQARSIEAQRGQIDSLRRQRSEGNLRAALRRDAPRPPQATVSTQAAPTSRGTTRPSTGAQGTVDSSWEPSLPSTSECRSAERELALSREASQRSQQLAHVRRALRLCPESADLHVVLGELYLAMERSGDAKFEFREALTLEPAHARAQRQLDSLR